MTAYERDTDELILVDLETPHGGGVRLGTLVLIRWMAVAGQLLALLIVGWGLDFDLHVHLTIPIVLVSALLNLWFSFRADRNARLDEKQSAAHLAFDLIHLSLLLFVTGGLANPFALLMLAPTSVSASILGQRSTKFLIAISLVLVTALAFTPFKLPWKGEPPELPPVLLAGVWVALCFTLVFLALYMARVGREGRHRARALAATQTALEQEQRLAALGTLAAAAAHELGTPLGTILLAAKELLDTWDGDDATRTDLELIVAETSRCRDILSELREHRKAGSASHFTAVDLEALLREAAGPHEGRGIQITYAVVGEEQLKAKRSPEFIHAFRNIVENAVGYARKKVQVSAGWDDDTVSIAVVDDGPGFDPQIIKRLGEPYVTTRQPTPGRDGGLGLGLFIAKTLLERSGATVEFGTGPDGGAEILVEWPRERLENKD
ncbi:ActS/PrrB/RegB family redox-sensitive histidine kinase [Kordiimonas gwangyangensis]|uniref:ActS/PrrB/RegB family redox-sensitive histidine kinase n=1 Tax=Kordiimonas gwangyangensis TaxID=288022 RepID=UPI00036B9E18|nr:ActS/PrrB/RegB family redox-sensitive histidine kinase [Kordiimonas gwangyangensis]